MKGVSISLNRSKCLACSTGVLKQSGNHMYCDSCEFSSFIVTDGYVDACSAVIGLLISNTEFSNEEQLKLFVLTLIDKHLPMLANYMHTIVSNKEGLLKVIVEAAKIHAVNLVIGDDVMNEKDDDLVCTCGSEQFSMEAPGKLRCIKCGDSYAYNEESQLYERKFVCVGCGHTVYSVLDEYLAICNKCSLGYFKQGDKLVLIER